MNCDRNSFLSDTNSFLRESKSFLSSVLSRLDWTEASLTSHKWNNDKVVSFDECITGILNSEDVSDEVNRNSSISERESMLNELISFPLPAKKEKEKSLIDKLSFERDMKRRRVGYKGRIHTKHKSQNEILRQVIAQQMETLEDSISGEISVEANIDLGADRGVKSSRIDISDCHVRSNPHIVWKYIRDIEPCDRKKNNSDSVKNEDNRLDKDIKYDKNEARRRRRFSEDRSEDRTKKRTLRADEKSKNPQQDSNIKTTYLDNTKTIIDVNSYRGEFQQKNSIETSAYSANGIDHLDKNENSTGLNRKEQKESDICGSGFSNARLDKNRDRHDALKSHDRYPSLEHSHRHGYRRSEKNERGRDRNKIKNKKNRHDSSTNDDDDEANRSSKKKKKKKKRNCSRSRHKSNKRKRSRSEDT